MAPLEQYRLAFSISPVPMLLVSSTGEILLTNPLFDSLFQYSPAELVGQNVEVLVPESHREHHPELRGAYFRHASKRNMGQGRDLNGITRNGDVVPLELGLDSVTIDGEVYALVVAIDIRCRKQQEQRMALAMDAAASAMIMVDDQGLIVFVNKAAASLFGYDEKELLAKPVELLVPDEIKRVHTVYRSSFMSSAEARPMAKELDLFALHHDGRKIPVEIALTPVDTPNGRMVMSTIIDLSERIAAEQAINAKSAELSLVNKELSRFAYSASHDLKSPLSSITGLLRVCMEDLDHDCVDEVRTNLEKCLQISLRSADKIESVLKIARVGADPSAYEQVDLQLLINEMWLDLTGRNENNVQLSLEFDHDVPVFTEIASLKVILENLLSNAIRYLDTEKTTHMISVSTSNSTENLVIRVADNGVGIAREFHLVIFDMFKRVDERSGDGLGLALLKKQLDRLKGTISLQSESGEGAEFTVCLPLVNRNDHENTSRSS